MSTTARMRLHLGCAWSGMLFAVLTLIALVMLAGFIPPPSPATGAEAVAEIYRQNTAGIRSGMVLMMFGAAAYIPFAAVTALFISRIEGGVGVVTIMQIMGGICNVLLFFYPCLWWLTSAYRPDRGPELTQLLHDAAWLQFVGGLAPFLFLMISVAIAAFVDDSERPVFPRWSGYVSLSAVVLFLPDQLLFFFKTGPFAWNGLFGWWIPMFVFFSWFLMMFLLLRSAIKRESGATLETQLSMQAGQ